MTTQNYYTDEMLGAINSARALGSNSADHYINELGRAFVTPFDEQDILDLDQSALIRMAKEAEINYRELFSEYLDEFNGEILGDKCYYENSVAQIDIGEDDDERETVSLSISVDMNGFYVFYLDDAGEECIIEDGFRDALRAREHIESSYRGAGWNLIWND